MIYDKESATRKNEQTRERNLEAVYQFYAENPGATQTDAMRATGLSYLTVRRRTREIEAGWKPKGN